MRGSTFVPPGRRGLLAAGLALAAGCAPRFALPGPAMGAPRDEGEAFVMPDGARLPLSLWPAEAEPRGVILALHGFSDYRRAFEIPAPLFTAAGWSVLAYDQRGFGAAPHPGFWPGHEALAADATEAARLTRARYPDLPLVLLGESMGAAVLLCAGASATPPPADAYVLSAPAVWGGEAMGGIGRAALRALAHIVPQLGFANASPFHRATDNEAALAAMARDPLVLRHTRVDALWGLVQAMDAALAAARSFPHPALILYGGRDDLIPPRAIAALEARLPGLASGRQRLLRYPEGHHLLLRDSIRARVVADSLVWLESGVGGLAGAGGLSYSLLGGTRSSAG